MSRASQDLSKATEPASGRSISGLVQRLTDASSITKGLGRTPASTLSIDFTINGHVRCNGEARFDGEVHGNVECLNLIVGQNGRITGDISAESVIVFGQIHGNVHARRVTLKSSAAVEGDIYHSGLGIEMGASFLGTSHKLLEPAAETVKLVTPQQMKTR